MPKTPTLGAVAKAQADEKTKTKLASALSAIAGALGLGGGDKPAAKMTKKTLTTKRVEMEESDEEASEANAEEEMSTGSTSDETENTGAEAEAEDTGAESAEAEAVVAAPKGDSGLARAVSKALNSPAVHQAFLAALPEAHRDLGALYSPHRLAAAAKRATGENSTFAAMGALADFQQRAKAATESVLTKQARLESRVAKVEGARRKDRVAAIVAVAKENGVPGATTKEGRAALRDYGMKFGTKALSGFLQAQGPGLRTKEAIPKSDAQGAVLGAPTPEAQKKMFEQAMAGLDAKGREEFMAIYAEKTKALNGAANVEA
jgi:hypothetical protein